MWLKISRVVSFILISNGSIHVDERRQKSFLANLIKSIPLADLFVAITNNCLDPGRHESQYVYSPRYNSYRGFISNTALY
jgi:hypothetical protein